MIDVRSYLVRAWRDWTLDNNFTPYIVVDCRFNNVKIPDSFQNQEKLTLNVSNIAANNFSLTQNSLSFSARFGGKLEQINLPILSIIGIYAKENNHGMWFNKSEQKSSFTLSD